MLPDVLHHRLPGQRPEGEDRGRGSRCGGRALRVPERERLRVVPVRPVSRVVCARAREHRACRSASLSLRSGPRLHPIEPRPGHRRRRRVHAGGALGVLVRRSPGRSRIHGAALRGARRRDQPRARRVGRDARAGLPRAAAAPGPARDEPLVPRHAPLHPGARRSAEALGRHPGGPPAHQAEGQDHGRDLAPDPRGRRELRHQALARGGRRRGGPAAARDLGRLHALRASDPLRGAAEARAADALETSRREADAGALPARVQPPAARARRSAAPAAQTGNARLAVGAVLRPPPGRRRGLHADREGPARLPRPPCAHGLRGGALRLHALHDVGRRDGERPRALSGSPPRPHRSEGRRRDPRPLAVPDDPDGGEAARAAGVRSGPDRDRALGRAHPGMGAHAP